MAVTATKLVRDYLFRVDVGEHSLRTDLGSKQGGQGSAPDPHELLEAALAACTAMTLQLYARRKQIPLLFADVQIDIVEEGTSNHIHRKVKLVGELSDEHKTRLLEIADKCPIHRFLERGAKITTEAVE